MIGAWLAFPAIQLLIWLGCGLAAESLAGRRLPGALLPGVGFCVTVCLSGIIAADADLVDLITPVILLVALAGIVISPPWRRWRGAGWPAATAVALFAFYAAPIVLSGDATFAGYIKLDDTASWMAFTDQVMSAGRDLSHLDTSTFLRTLEVNIGQGYPIGVFLPLGIGSKLVGIDVAWVIQPYMALLGAVLGLGLWQLADGAITSFRARALTAFLAGQAALLYAYYLWGGIKELAAAAIVATLAGLAPGLLRRGARPGELLPAAIVCAGLIGCLNPPGLVWAIPILLATGYLALRRLGGRDTFWRAGGLALATLLIAAVPVLAAGAIEPPTSSPLDDGTAQGNLYGPLSILHLFGIWPGADFRDDPQLPLISNLLCAFVAAAAAFGLFALVRRGRIGPTLYVLGALAGAGILGLVGSPWVDGKALATASPALLFAALLLAGLLAETAGHPARIVGWALLVVLTGGVLWSTVSQWGGVSLAPRAQLAELESIGHRIDGEGPTLMTEYQPYGVRHFLRFGDAEGASELRFRPIRLMNGQYLRKGLWADTDAFEPSALGTYKTLVLRRSPLQSRPPSPYTLTDSGAYYETWKRDRLKPFPIARIGQDSRLSTDVKLSCPRIRGLAMQAGRAGRLAAAAPLDPVVVPPARLSFPDSWPKVGARPIPVGGGIMRATVELPATGDYDIWLGGSVRSSLTASIDGMEVGSIRHQLNNARLFMNLGKADLSAGTHQVSLDFGGADLHVGSARAVDPVGPLILSRYDPANSQVLGVPAAQYRRLCGRRWDWVEALP